MKLILAVISSFLFFLHPTFVYACRAAAFGQGSSRYIVKSFDFDVDGGQFFRSDRGQAKKALVLKPSLKPLTWISRYSSVIFTQLGPNLPFGGMNERGLTVEALWLEKSPMADEDSRLAINESQYIQYLLDRAENVEEVINLSNDLQISRVFAPVHYFICDKAQICAVAEMSKAGLRFKKISDRRQQMVENISHGQMIKVPGANKIFASFTKHLSQAQTADVKSSFEWLEKVKTPGWSRWQVVYDLERLELQFRSVDADGRVGEIQVQKIQDPLIRNHSLFYTAQGVFSWTKSVFEENIRRFSGAFPDFAQLVPVLRDYLQASFDHETEIPTKVGQVTPQ